MAGALSNSNGTEQLAFLAAYLVLRTGVQTFSRLICTPRYRHRVFHPGVSRPSSSYAELGLRAINFQQFAQIELFQAAPLLGPTPCISPLSEHKHLWSELRLLMMQRPPVCQGPSQRPTHHDTVPVAASDNALRRACVCTGVQRGHNLSDDGSPTDNLCTPDSPERNGSAHARRGLTQATSSWLKLAGGSPLPFSWVISIWSRTRRHTPYRRCAYSNATELSVSLITFFVFVKRPRTMNDHEREHG